MQIKIICFSIFLMFVLSIYPESVYINEPEFINVNEEMKLVVKELQILEFVNLGYTIDTIFNNADYIIKSKIIRFEDNRAQYIMQLYSNDELLFTINKIITKADKLDLFTKRMIIALMNREDFVQTKEVGKTIKEEETLSYLEEPFITKISVGLGFHLGTAELTNPDYSYVPVYFSIGVNFLKPDYMFNVKTVNIIEGFGLKIGSYKIATRKVNSLIYGGSLGVCCFWGFNNENGQTNISPFLSPIVSLSAGGMLNRTSSIFLKPEAELSFMYRKSINQFISSLNVSLSLLF